MAATLFAVSNPEEPRPNSVVTIADILAAIEETQILHPDWFIEGQGWGPKTGEEKTK